LHSRPNTTDRSSTIMAPPTFVGGKLSLKGDKKVKKAKKKSKKSKHRKSDHEEEKKLRWKDEKDEQKRPPSDSEDDDEMTEAERRALKFKMERENKELEIIAKQSHRDRIEKFNENLGKLTEHNDIPRVSAAGNG